MKSIIDIVRSAGSSSSPLTLLFANNAHLFHPHMHVYAIGRVHIIDTSQKLKVIISTEVIAISLKKTLLAYMELIANFPLILCSPLVLNRGFYIDLVFGWAAVCSD